ncbi:hypothetical protein C8F01DRAFT_1084541 [Mycena amicta]|nr:hypothetical protein C8F01DRAFT_1084541 [Mycena amicta]
MSKYSVWVLKILMPRRKQGMLEIWNAYRSQTSMFRLNSPSSGSHSTSTWPKKHALTTSVACVSVNELLLQFRKRRQQRYARVTILMRNEGLSSFLCPATRKLLHNDEQSPSSKKHISASFWLRTMRTLMICVRERQHSHWMFENLIHAARVAESALGTSSRGLGTSSRGLGTSSRGWEGVKSKATTQPSIDKYRDSAGRRRKTIFTVGPRAGSECLPDCHCCTSLKRLPMILLPESSAEAFLYARVLPPTSRARGEEALNLFSFEPPLRRVPHAFRTHEAGLFVKQPIGTNPCGNPSHWEKEK